MRAFLILIVLCSGCTTSKLLRPAPADTLPGAVRASESIRSAAERSLRRFLGSSRAIQLLDEKLSSDAVHDFASYYVPYALETGWEGTYHARLIFVKKKTDRDWSTSRIFNDPGPFIYADPFPGPIGVLEEKGLEWGKEKPNKAPEPTTMAVTPRAIEGASK